MEFIWGGMAIMSLGYGLFIDFSEEFSMLKIVIFEIVAGMSRHLFILFVLDIQLGIVFVISPS